MGTMKQVRTPPAGRRWPAQLVHELKTPLATVRDSAELLADGTLGPLNDTQREVAEILRRNSVELQRLIERMIDERGVR
jgi:two-component system, NtrC family, sensor histidine kinase GlrK